MKDNSETSQAATKQNADSSTAKSSEAHRFDILPRNDMSEKIGCDLPGSKTKHATHDQTSKCCDCHGDECLLNCHSA